jgi:hypothetical protein
MEEAKSGEAAFAELEDHTFDETMEGIYKDDVYHFLLRKYRNEAIMNMSEEEYQEMIEAMELSGRATPSIPGEDQLKNIMKKADKNLH